MTNKQTAYDLHHEACFRLQTALPTATADISNCSYKSKHFTYTCTVCDRQMEALGDVQCYLWHGGGETRGSIEIVQVYHAYSSTGWGGSFC